MESDDKTTETVYKVVFNGGNHLESAVVGHSKFSIKYPVMEWVRNKTPMFCFATYQAAYHFWLIDCAGAKIFEVWKGQAINPFPIDLILPMGVGFFEMKNFTTKDINWFWKQALLYVYDENNGDKAVGTKPIKDINPGGAVILWEPPLGTVGTFSLILETRMR